METTIRGALDEGRVTPGIEVRLRGIFVYDGSNGLCWLSEDGPTSPDRAASLLIEHQDLADLLLAAGAPACCGGDIAFYFDAEVVGSVWPLENARFPAALRALRMLKGWDIDGEEFVVV